jgi:hypothetical protein
LKKNREAKERFARVIGRSGIEFYKITFGQSQIYNPDMILNISWFVNGKFLRKSFVLKEACRLPTACTYCMVKSIGYEQS